ncbi:MAG: hypothetical protein IJO91_08970 [Oscillospiraceae bacterium]|nr:hypothetical protein [Oscillospiraceae bacterium]
MALSSSNYGQHAVDERFGYMEKGSFRAAFGNEKFILYVALAVAVAAYFVIGFTVYVPNFFDTGRLFYTIVTLLLIAVDIAVFATVYNIVMAGKEGSYYADSIKFTVTLNGKRDIFYYEDVMYVDYQTFSTFRRPRGYAVNIVTRSGEFRYHYLAPKHKKYGNFEDTPFYILKKHAEQDTTPEHTEYAVPEDIPADLDRPVIRPVYSRLPENSVQTYVPEHWKPEDKIKTVDSEDDMVIAKGTFRVPFKGEAVIFTVGTIIFALIFSTCAGFILNGLATASIMAFTSEIFDILVIVAILSIFAYGTFINIINHGRDVDYISTKKEFTITDKDDKRVIYLCDAERVEYLPLKSFGRQRGWKVKIHTKYTVIEYSYLFSKVRKFIPEKDTPFRVIEELIGTVQKEQPVYRRTE